MSGKNDRKIRKGINALKKDERDVADEIVRELLNAPFKHRFQFAMKLIFRK